MRMQAFVGIRMLKCHNIAVLDVFNAAGFFIVDFSDCPPVVVIAVRIQSDLLLCVAKGGLVRCQGAQIRVPTFAASRIVVGVGMEVASSGSDMANKHSGPISNINGCVDASMAIQCLLEFRRHESVSFATVWQ